MSKYSIHISVMKTVDDWDPENGAQGKERVVDTWETTIESDSEADPENVE